MEISITQKIRRPTLILDEDQARKNLRHMLEKAKSQSISFRPHFKTHQSLEIGEWFREEGVDRAAVSSVSMAEYFSIGDWKDITIAFPVNLREMDKVCVLARKIELGVLVESLESAAFLKEALDSDINVWIKIDTGLHRTGILWNDQSSILELATHIADSKRLNFTGILTHAGQTYDAKTTDGIRDLYSESNTRMNDVRDYLESAGFQGLKISVGDTPGCWLSENLGDVDEIRPGNFLFFDAMMEELGVCRRSDIAVNVACPVVAKHQERLEVVVYGGGIHLSKQAIHTAERDIYGYICMPGVGEFPRYLSKENYVSALSQEHGVVKLERNEFDTLHVGDTIYIQPVHSCLVVDLLGDYLTQDGRIIRSMNSERIKNLQW